MSQLRISAIFCSSLSQLVAYYLMMPFLLNVLQKNGVSSSMQGFFSAVGWSGVLVAMFTIRFFLLKIGRNWLFIFATALPALCAVFISLVYDLFFWIFLSFLSGLGAGYRWSLSEGMLLEEYSNVDGSNAGGGKIIGWFEALSGVTSVIGPFIFYLIGADLILTARVVVFLYCCGAAFAILANDSRKGHLLESNQGKDSLVRIGISPFLFVLCVMSFCGGFYESGFMSVIPVLGSSIGFSIEGSSVLMILCGLGSALAMIPLGYFLDEYFLSHSSRLNLLAALALCVCVSCFGLFLFSDQIIVVWLVVFLLGAAGGGLFTVSLIILGSTSKTESILLGSSTLVLFYTLGGLVSSGVSGYLIEFSRHGAYPLFMSVVALFAFISVKFISWEGR